MSYLISVDGYEERSGESIINDEYMKYFKWIESIRTMCDEHHLVRKATGEQTEFTDEMEEAYYDPEHDENTMNHYLLDNGLHVFIKDGSIRIQEEEHINDFKAQRYMRMRLADDEIPDNQISFTIGAEGPELPYQISYSENYMYGNLPIKGLLNKYSDIRDMLENEANYLESNDVNSVPSNAWMQTNEIIELFKSSIAFYDKISDMVKTIQQQELNDKSNLQQREEELSALEAEEQTISQAEALIDRQAEKEGQNIGE